MDFSAYQPAAHVLDRLRRVDFVAVVGPTAVGKTTVIKAAMARDPAIHLVLNNTTRAPRPGEQEGVDYQFRSREEMLARIKRGEYAQVAPSVLGEIYATAPEGYATSGVAVMAVLAQAMGHFRALPFKRCSAIFMLPPDWETWQRRLVAHGFTPEHLKRRLAEAARSLAFAAEDQEVKILINQNLDLAAEDFITLAHGRPLSARLQADQSRARRIVADLLDHLRTSAPTRP
ncbi:MAG TPA: hypothetical protein VJP80_07075 [Candidatus Saccharimonadales bacterium]|nr:hypothetical protein [Candidatus Saccharimonadales bacterium]